VANQVSTRPEVGGGAATNTSEVVENQRQPRTMVDDGLPQ
jgi:hypothetical protein